MAKYQVGFLGCGNMGGPLVEAVAKKIPAGRIAVCGKTTVRADKLAAKLGVISTDTDDVIENSTWIFVAVKPQHFGELFDVIKEKLKERKDRFILVSVAAGIKTSKVTELADANYPVIRIMPNTPVAIGEGVVLFCSNDAILKEDIVDFSDMLQFAGRLCPLDESLMDAGCSVSGCGPAFAYMFIDALAQGGAACGLDKEESLRLAAQTVLGSAKLLLESGADPESLITAVCSPGGSTIEGVKKLRENDLYATLKAAVEASYKRNQELG